MIINLGLPKSGTTTLATALQKAGLHCADHKVRQDDGVPGYRGVPIAKMLYDGHMRGDDPLGQLVAYDALTEISILRPNLSLWPQTDFGLLAHIRARHPETRFVLTRRPARDIADSMIRWRNLGTQRMPNGAIPGLPAGYGTNASELARFVAGHHAFVQRAFGRDPRTLILDMGAEDARERLSDFLGLDLPWWGRANVNAG